MAAVINVPLSTSFVNNNNKKKPDKIASDSPRQVDFAIGLVNSVLNLPDWQVKLFGVFKLQKNCNESCSSINIVLS